METERTRREPTKVRVLSRRPAGPQLPDSVSELLRLQRAAGNQATASLLAKLQRDPESANSLPFALQRHPSAVEHKHPMFKETVEEKSGVFAAYTPTYSDLKGPELEAVDGLIEAWKKAKKGKAKIAAKIKALEALEGHAAAAKAAAAALTVADQKALAKKYDKSAMERAAKQGLLTLTHTETFATKADIANKGGTITREFSVQIGGYPAAYVYHAHYYDKVNPALTAYHFKPDRYGQIRYTVPPGVAALGAIDTAIG